ncbi:MAG: AsnC family transcriptional regulator [Euryarchaeota archaeon]|nr:AsnC family transcriptional regulator [Euryarchaeota archaeon]MBR40705.1 AsnC family transcriptional regulator [Euryarchaeota archaeon]
MPHRSRHKRPVWPTVRMTSLAWILISCEPGRERDVYLQLLDMPVVSEVSVVYGELDLVARIDFESEREMSKTLIEEMRHVEGIRKTETLIAVEV